MYYRNNFIVIIITVLSSFLAVFVIGRIIIVHQRILLLPVEVEKVESAMSFDVAQHLRQKKMRLRDDASDKPVRQVILFGENAATSQKFRDELGATGIFVRRDGERVLLLLLLFAPSGYYSAYRYAVHRLVISLLRLPYLLLQDIHILALPSRSADQLANPLFPFLLRSDTFDVSKRDFHFGMKIPLLAIK